jgi:hypothetical protein
MTGQHWFDRFVAAGPDYPGARLSAAETQALLLKAGIGAGLPLGHAQDLSALAKLLMSDPQLIAMAAAALEGDHSPHAIEGTDDHVVVERARVMMAGPVIVDHLVGGASRVVVHSPDWPLLLWPMLAQARDVYGLCVDIVSGAKGVVTITVADSDGLDPLGPPQPVPHLVTARLEGFAAQTYVPASEASRLAGAGAGLLDND